MKRVLSSRLYAAAAIDDYTIRIMPQMIHYQDDLFSLSVLVKSLDLVLAIETDPEYFADHLGAEIGFLDLTLKTFASLLEQNTLLIERAEYLKLLERTVKAFIGVLDRLSNASYPRAQSFVGDGARIDASAKEQRALLGHIRELLHSSLAEDAETDLVSQDELSELLKE
jgi:hypothetical protein